MSTPDAIASRAATLLQPIPGAEPGGQNAAYDPRYEAVRAELAKLDTPTGGEVDWQRVGEGCHELLTTFTKDFLLASHNATALLQLERWGGLAVGLAVLDGMLSQWWEVGFPPVARLRGRGNALDWLVARLEVAIPTLGVRPEELAMFEATRELWATLTARARDRLGEFAPGMGGVTDALGRAGANLPASPGAASSDTTPIAASTAAPQAPTAPIPAAAPDTAPAPQAAPAPVADPFAEFTAKAEPWLAAIPGPNPAGAETRYELSYEAARVEIAKMESVTDSNVEWKLVHTHTSQLLQTKGKDLLMAAYLAFAKLKLSGLAEFSVGLAVLDGLLGRYWEGLQPERLRGRTGAMSWLVDQLDKALGEVKLEPKDRGDVLGVQIAVKRLAASTRERMASEGPSFGPISERLQRMLLAIPEEKPVAPPPPPPAAVAAVAPTATATPSVAAAPALPTAAAPASAEGVVTFLQESGRNLVSAANQLREASRSNPTSYRLMRTGLYIHLDGPPPSEVGGKSQIPPLAPAKRTQLVTLETNGKWEALIDESEAALGMARFCLDLHRFTYQALAHLGDAFVPARDVLVAELAGLLVRMPQLPDLFARDGTPLTNGDTKTWIAQTVLAGSGAAPSAAAAGSNDDDAKVFAEVRGLLTSGKATDAMRVGQARIDASTTSRQRFVRRLALAGALLDGAQPMLARGLYAALERELREHELFAWEPELAARCLEGFVRAIRAAAKAGARYEQADAVYERLCLVDPSAAARLAT